VGEEGGGRGEVPEFVRRGVGRRKAEGKGGFQGENVLRDVSLAS